MIKKRKRRKIGDIIEIKTPKGLVYAQYTHEEKRFCGPLIRILPGFYEKRPDDFKSIVEQKEKYFVFFPFDFYLKDGDVEIVGNEELPERVKPFPLMKAMGATSREGKVLNWWLFDGTESYFVGEELTEEQKKLPTEGIIPKWLLIARIVEDWKPEDDCKWPIKWPAEPKEIKKKKYNQTIIDRDKYMNIDKFWNLIDKGKNSKKPEAILKKELKKLSKEEIIAFQQHLDILFHNAYRWDLWAAAYIMRGGCSDDAFKDFRYGLISKGKELYEAALKNPDSLSDYDIKEDICNELFAYVALEVYEDKTGEEMPRLDFEEQKTPSGEAWDFDDEEENKKRLPKLFLKYKNHPLG